MIRNFEMKRDFRFVFVVVMLAIGICCTATTVNAKSAFDTTKTTVSQNKKITTKKVKLSSKATKNKTTKSTKRAVSNSSDYSKKTVVIEKEVVTTTTTESTWKKGSNIKTVVTTVVTRTTTTTTTRFKGQISVDTLAPKSGSSVRNAFKTLGFKIVVDPTAKYRGVTSYSKRTITLQYADNSIYHELGHFISFVASQYCNTDSFKNIYNSEKGKYTGNNKAYVTQNSSEYFAESYSDFVLAGSSLKSQRPKTYAAVQKALAQITTSQVKKVQNAYGSIWEATGN